MIRYKFLTKRPTRTAINGEAGILVYNFVKDQPAQAAAKINDYDFLLRHKPVNKHGHTLAGQYQQKFTTLEMDPA